MFVHWEKRTPKQRCTHGKRLTNRSAYWWQGGTRFRRRYWWNRWEAGSRWTRDECLRHSFDERTLLIARLVESYRDHGRTRQRRLAYLGSCFYGPHNESAKEAARFWQQASAALDRLGDRLTVWDRRRIEHRLTQRVPQVTATDLATEAQVTAAACDQVRAALPHAASGRMLDDPGEIFGADLHRQKAAKAGWFRRTFGIYPDDIPMSCNGKRGSFKAEWAALVDDRPIVVMAVRWRTTLTDGRAERWPAAPVREARAA